MRGRALGTLAKQIEHAVPHFRACHMHAAIGPSDIRMGDRTRGNQAGRFDAKTEDAHAIPDRGFKPTPDATHMTGWVS